MPGSVQNPNSSSAWWQKERDAATASSGLFSWLSICKAATQCRASAQLDISQSCSQYFPWRQRNQWAHHGIFSHGDRLASTARAGSPQPGHLCNHAQGWHWVCYSCLIPVWLVNTIEPFCWCCPCVCETRHRAVMEVCETMHLGTFLLLERNVFPSHSWHVGLSLIGLP